MVTRQVDHRNKKIKLDAESESTEIRGVPYREVSCIWLMLHGQT